MEINLTAENIKHDFFDQHDGIMNGVFYNFRPNYLSIGGNLWDELKKSHGITVDCFSTRSDHEAKSIESKLLICFSHSRVLHEHLSNREDPHIPWTIDFSHFWLHDWKPLLQTFRQHNVGIETLVVGSMLLDPFSFCPLSEKGAKTLGWALNSKKSGFRIEHFDLYSRYTSRVMHTKWIHGMSDEIINLTVDNSPSWFLPHFVQRFRFYKLECKSQVGDDSFPLFSFRMQKIDESTVVDEALRGNGSILSMEINLDHHTKRISCQNLSLVLRSVSVGSLTVNCTGFVRGNDYNIIFQKAGRCRSITIREPKNVEDNDMFPWHALVNLFRGRRILEDLCFYPDKRQVEGQRHLVFLRVLRRANLSFLRMFHLDSVSQDEDAFEALCNHLQKNGPRHLKIAIDNVYRNNDRLDENDDGALERLGESLRQNRRVEHLTVEIINLDLTAATILKFIQIVCHMPQLSQFEFRAAEKTSFKTPDEEIYDECDEEPPPGDDDYARLIASRIEDETELKKMVVQQIMDKSDKIERIRVPFDDHGLDLLLRGMRNFRRLLHQGDIVTPDGIWPHALARIEKKSPSTMFYVLRQVPRLLERNEGNDDNLRPMLSVPHHPNCQGCQEQSGKVCVLKGRFVGKRFVLHEEKV